MKFVKVVLGPNLVGQIKNAYYGASLGDSAVAETVISVDGLPSLKVPGGLAAFVDIVIAFIDSAEKFYCQLQNQAENIEKLSEDLNKFYITPAAKPYINPLPGTLCVAKYSLDQCWYRGFVLERPTPALVEIYFVDYGNTERVLKGDLRILTEEFQKMPPQAFKCKLKGISSSPTMNKKFRDCAEGCKLTIKLESLFEQAFDVTLFDDNCKEVCNINDYLTGRSNIMPSKLTGENQVQPTAASQQQSGGPSQQQQQPLTNGFAGRSDGFQQRKENFGGDSDRGSAGGGFRSERGGGFGGGSRRFDGNDRGGFRGGRGGGERGGRGGGFGNSDGDNNFGNNDSSGGFGGGGGGFRNRSEGGFGNDEGRRGGRGGGFGGGYNNDGGDRGGRGGFRGRDRDDRGGYRGGFRDDRGGRGGGGGFGSQNSGGGFARDGGGFQSNGFGSTGTNDFGNSSGFGSSSGFQSKEPATNSFESPSPQANGFSAPSDTKVKVEKEKEKVVPTPVAEPKIDAPTGPAVPYDIPRFSALKIPAGNIAEVFLSVSVSPNEVYAQLVDEADRLQTLNDKLQTFCRRADAKKVPKDKVYLGMACAAQYSDDKAFYRCIPTLIKGDDVEVSFVDFGNSEVVRSIELFQLTGEFTADACYAVKCKVSGVSPLDGQTTFAPECQQDIDVAAVEDDESPRKFVCTFMSRFEPCLAKFKCGDFLLDEKLAEMGHCQKVDNTPYFDGPFKKLDYKSLARSTFVVSYADTPESMHIYPSHMQHEQEELMEQLNADYADDSVPQLNVADQVKIGAACVAKYDADEMWYRSEIVELNGDKCTVRFVDYGNAQKCQVSTLRRVKFCYGLLPAMSLHVSMDGVVAHDSAALEKFNEMVQQITVDYAIEFLNAGPADPADSVLLPMVKVFLPGHESKPSINDQLNAALGELCEAKVFSETKQLQEQTLVNGEVSNGGAASEPEPAALAKNITDKLVQYASAQSSKQTEPTIPAAVTDSTKVEPSADIPTTSDAASRFPPFKIPVGNTADVYLSVYSHPDEIFLELSSEDEKLQAMNEKLQAFCLRDNARKVQPDKIFLGKACAAKYSADGEFYRCVPTQISDDGVNVSFVDFGNTEKLTSTELYELTDEFLTEPCRALLCKISGLAPPPADDSGSSGPATVYPTEISEDIDSLADGEDENPKKYDCTFLSRFEPCLVELKCAEFDMRQKLVDMGHCQKVDDPVYFDGSFRKLDPILLKQCLFVVSLAESPSLIHVYPSHMQSRLDELQAQLAVDYADESSAADLPDDKLTVGTACVAKYTEDDAWYRAEIVEIVGDGRCTVRFVDYGNTQECPVGILKRAKYCYGLSHAFSLTVRMDGVGMTNSPIMQEKFVELVQQIEVDYFMEFVGASFEEGSAVPVKIFVPGDPISVNDKLNEALGAINVAAATSSDEKSDCVDVADNIDNNGVEVCSNASDAEMAISVKAVTDSLVNHASDQN